MKHLIIGIIAFAKFLHWLLKHYHRETLLVMAGFIIGSLVKVWPWSNMPDIICSQFEEALPLMESRAFDEMIALYGGQVDMHVWGAVAFAVVGLVLVVGIEIASNLIRKKSDNK